MYLGYVIGEGEMKIDAVKMEAIMKWPIPTYVSKEMSFVGEAQYLRKFIALFLVEATTLQALTTSGKDFQWRKGQ